MRMLHPVGTTKATRELGRVAFSGNCRSVRFRSPVWPMNVPGWRLFPYEKVRLLVSLGRETTLFASAIR